MSCSHFGSHVIGSDIDGTLLHGRGIENFIQNNFFNDVPLHNNVHNIAAINLLLMFPMLTNYWALALILTNMYSEIYLAA